MRVCDFFQLLPCSDVGNSPPSGVKLCGRHNVRRVERPPLVPVTFLAAAWRFQNDYVVDILWRHRHDPKIAEFLRLVN